MAGALLVAAGLLTTVAVFVAFVRADGTPMPGADTEHLVVTGLNRYVRNPIYVGATAIFAGETLLLLRWNMLAFTLIAWAATAAFVRLYEEPKLRRRFGAPYETYRATTPAWIPHFAKRKRRALPTTRPHKARRSQPERLIGSCQIGFPVPADHVSRDDRQQPETAPGDFVAHPIRVTGATDLAPTALLPVATPAPAAVRPR